MSKPVFDAASFIKIDMSSGSISSVNDEQLFLFPSAIAELLPSGEALYKAAAEWGKKHGICLSEIMNTSENEPGVDMLSQHLGGTLAALGMGRALVEIVGDALMFKIETKDTAPDNHSRSTLLAGFISGYLSAVSGHPFVAMDLGITDDNKRMFWAGNPHAADLINEEAASGCDPAVAVLKLGGMIC